MLSSSSRIAQHVARSTQRRAVLSRGFAAKMIKFGVDGRSAMLEGVNTLADAVEVSESFQKQNLCVSKPHGIGLRVSILVAPVQLPSASSIHTRSSTTYCGSWEKGQRRQQLEREAEKRMNLYYRFRCLLKFFILTYQIIPFNLFAFFTYRSHSVPRVAMLLSNKRMVHPKSPRMVSPWPNRLNLKTHSKIWGHN